MKKEEIIKNNRMIAEFMHPNVTEEFESGKVVLDKGMMVKTILYAKDYELLRYHSDWNWLHRVVDKISEYRMVYSKEADWVCDCKIVVYRHILYREVVAFIKWYNENVILSPIIKPDCYSPEDFKKDSK